MIMGFNHEPMAVLPPPFCIYIEGYTYTTIIDCSCKPRPRYGNVQTIPVNSGSAVLLKYGDYVDVWCNEPHTPYWGGEAPTPKDVSVLPFLENGNVYVHIVDGRIGRLFTVELVAEDPLGNLITITQKLELV